MAIEFPSGKIVPTGIEQEMKRSYIDYAMSVIVDRALPDVRDGLKPVQRRILYGMSELGLRPDRPHKKSARIVGEVMGKYHPHGDVAIYDAMVRMAQDFSFRYQLVDGHGNFGCFTGDTGIKLLDGTEKTFAELAEAGPDARFYVYSVDKNGRIVGGEGRNARVTRRGAQLVELTLDTGDKIRCTPDHRFLLKSGAYKEAKELTPEDSLMAGYLSAAPLGPHVDDLLDRAESYNHRVIDIRWLEQREDVYDITVDHHHNFLLAAGVFVRNSVDGDPPAAMRYSEARLSKLALEMLRDIDKDTVDFVPNFDDTLEQPAVLPARFPNLLANGSQGIAVGMATNIPPHNLGELIDGIVMLIDNPEASVKDLLRAIKGPDFPTGALILGREAVREAYATGRGRIKVRGRAGIEPMAGGRYRIVVTELPYMVNKASLIEKIAELHREKQIDGISELRDESDRTGMRIVIELRRDGNPRVVLNRLYKHTALEDTFGVIMLALVDGEPRVLNLRDALYHYLKYQKEVVTRRSRFELRRAEERAHILEGLRIALAHIDEIIALIRRAANDEAAKKGLMEKFGLTEKQAVAILDMQLRRLTGLEREKIEAEYQELLKTIARLKEILADESKLYGLVKTELLEIKEKYADPRRTEIVSAEPELEVEDLIAEEDVAITLTHQGYIKRVPLDTYRAQRRGGRGITAITTRGEDFVEHLYAATTHTYLLFFTNRGRVHRLKVHEIPEVGRNARGTAIINLLQVEKDETVQAALPIRSFDDEHYLLMGTRRGTVKKTVLSEFDSPRQGLIAINLDADDELIDVRLTDGNQEVVIVTRNGQAIRFPEEDVRPMGRAARGVRGITLGYGDIVVSMDVVQSGGEVLVVTEKGFGKRTLLEDYRRTARGGKGIRTLHVTDKNGPIVGSRIVRENDELMLISAAGIAIRMAVKDISRQGRATQGVRLMRLEEGTHVVAVALLPEREQEEGPAPDRQGLL